VRKILDLNNVYLLSFKNFQQLIYHSFDSTDFNVTISKRDLASLYFHLYQNRKTLAITQPPENDVMYKHLLHIKPGEMKELREADAKEKVNFKLKTRLLAHEGNENVFKCKFCNVVLPQSINSLDTSEIVEQYEPEDKETLFSMYCQLLKVVPEIKKT